MIKLSKTKTEQKSRTENSDRNGRMSQVSANGNHNGAIESTDSKLRELNKTYTAARTKKEKDAARKELTLATFNATYESHQKRRS